MNIFILVLEIIGTIAFAISGAMTAMKKNLDVLGVIILSAVTACCGGLLRDVFLGVFPANMFVNPMYVGIAALVGLIMFIIFYILRDPSLSETKWYKTTLNLTDAIGLGIFVVIGCDITFKLHTDWFIVTFMAVITACGGGIIRDILVMKIPNVFCKHIYCVATIVGAFLYYLFLYLNLTSYVAIPVVIVTIILIRMLAYHFELSLPKVIFKSKNDVKN